MKKIRVIKLVSAVLIFILVLTAIVFWISGSGNRIKDSLKKHEISSEEKKLDGSEETPIIKNEEKSDMHSKDNNTVSDTGTDEGQNTEVDIDDTIENSDKNEIADESLENKEENIDSEHTNSSEKNMDVSETIDNDENNQNSEDEAVENGNELPFVPAE